MFFLLVRKRHEKTILLLKSLKLNFSDLTELVKDLGHHVMDSYSRMIFSKTWTEKCADFPFPLYNIFRRLSKVWFIIFYDNCKTLYSLSYRAINIYILTLYNVFCFCSKIKPMLQNFDFCYHHRPERTSSNF